MPGSPFVSPFGSEEELRHRFSPSGLIPLYPYLGDTSLQSIFLRYPFSSLLHNDAHRRNSLIVRQICCSPLGLDRTCFFSAFLHSLGVKSLYYVD